MFKFNPFKPGSIVGPGMFSGRADELEIIDRALFQTKNGNPFHFLLHGERGIGKSSLMYYAKLLGTGRLDSWHKDEKRNFLTIEADLDPSNTFRDIIRKIGNDLSKKVNERQSVKSAAKGIWDFLKKLEAFGVKYNDSQPSIEDSDLIETLADSFAATLENLGDGIDGAVILIDESDKPAASANLGGFLKLFTERLSKRSCNRVAIGLAGISTVIEKLKSSHESSPRILSHILLEPLLPNERKSVVMNGLEQANKSSEVQITVTPEALEWIAHISEGFPHFIQQYAFSAFEADTDNVIDIRDVQTGAYKENGALDQLGVSYFEDMYSDQINSDEYRKALQVMAENPEDYMSRKDIGEKAELKETTLTNALRALKDRGIILPHRERSGLYKLPTSSFAAWIRARTRRERERANSEPLF